MTNVYSDLLKLNAKKASDFSEGLKNQASLAKMRYDVGAGVATGQDDASNTFGAMRKQLGDGHQHGWRAAISGLLGGLELGSKSAANNERREQANKMAETFSYLEGIANEANKRRTMHEKQQGLQAQITPELEALTKNMKMLPYDDVVKVGNNLVDRINQSGGTNYKISMIDQQNGKVLLTESGKPDQKVDLFEMFPKIREEQNIDYLTKKAIETADIDNNHKQAYIDDVNNRWNPKKKYDQNYGGQQGKNDADALQDLVEREKGIKLARFKLDEAKKLFKGGNVISGKSFAAAASRLTGEAFNSDAMSDTQAFEAAVKGITGYVKNNVSWGNANMKEFDNIVGQLPLTEYTPQAVATIMDQLERLMTQEFEDIYKDRQKYNDFNTKNQNSQQQPISPENPLPLTPEEQQNVGKLPMIAGTQIDPNAIKEEMKRRGLT